MSMMRPAVECSECIGTIVGFCGNFTGEDLAQIAALARPVRLRRNQLVDPGSNAQTTLLILREGVVKICQSLIDGRHQTVDFLTAGDVLLRPNSDAPSGRSIEVAADVEACELRLADLQRPDEAVHKLVHSLLSAAFTEIDRKNHQVILLGRKRADERVASFLLDLHRRAARRGAVHSVKLPMSRAEIADYLSLTTETVSRAFTVLREEGLIRLKRRDEVILCDPVELARVAAGGASLSVR